MSELSLSESTVERLQPFIGVKEGPSPWFTVTQDAVTAFADLTQDHNFIHIDPERAARETHFGGTIAHGFYTVSMLSYLFGLIPHADDNPFRDAVTMVNYGFNKLRFVSPVKIGQEIRVVRTLNSARPKGPDWVEIAYDVVVEINGESRPALKAEWLVLMICGPGKAE
ncbi:MAG: MaoC family dehydratase [Planctomycetaceae bacterium]|nr:MaoC family dehydratase [Planctomycetaceae bacterium]MCA9111964.1 MaoC family dehydratase [Planctomycetaceae bacterium]